MRGNQKIQTGKSYEVLFPPLRKKGRCVILALDYAPTPQNVDGANFLGVLDRKKRTVFLILTTC